MADIVLNILWEFRLRRGDTGTLSSWYPLLQPEAVKSQLSELRPIKSLYPSPDPWEGNCNQIVTTIGNLPTVASVLISGADLREACYELSGTRTVSASSWYSNDNGQKQIQFRIQEFIQGQTSVNATQEFLGLAVTGISNLFPSSPSPTSATSAHAATELNANEEDMDGPIWIIACDARIYSVHRKVPLYALNYPDSGYESTFAPFSPLEPPFPYPPGGQSESLKTTAPEITWVDYVASVLRPSALAFLGAYVNIVPTSTAYPSVDSLDFTDGPALAPSVLCSASEGRLASPSVFWLTSILGLTSFYTPSTGIVRYRRALNDDGTYPDDAVNITTALSSIADRCINMSARRTSEFIANKQQNFSRGLAVAFLIPVCKAHQNVMPYYGPQADLSMFRQIGADQNIVQNRYTHLLKLPCFVPLAMAGITEEHQTSLISKWTNSLKFLNLILSLSYENFYVSQLHSSTHTYNGLVSESLLPYTIRTATRTFSDASGSTITRILGTGSLNSSYRGYLGQHDFAENQANYGTVSNPFYPVIHPQDLSVLLNPDHYTYPWYDSSKPIVHVCPVSLTVDQCQYFPDEDSSGTLLSFPSTIPFPFLHTSEEEKPSVILVNFNERGGVGGTLDPALDGVGPAGSDLVTRNWGISRTRTAVDPIALSNIAVDRRSDGQNSSYGWWGNLKYTWDWSTATWRIERLHPFVPFDGEMLEWS